MCGIIGIVSERAGALAALGDGLKALRHRGPDDEGVWQDRGVALGHRRLSIIDLEGGHQPIPNEDETRWILCNGEIYNYLDLRRELIDRGHRFRTRSDSEVILHLYEEYGEEGCLARLRGMFAFAIWDGTKRSLFIARDHLGQKPLFYAHRGEEFWFASEIKGVLAMDRNAPAPVLEALHQYLALRFIAPPLTMYQGVAKLPPAHFLVFAPGRGLRIRRYWQPDYEPKLKGSEDDLLDQLEEVMVETVGLHMVSDVPVGAFLSGGFDSSLVLALATKHAKGPLPTFTLGLPYRDFDEAPHARAVAEHYGTEHHEQSLVPSLRRHLPALVHYLDEPSDPLSVAVYLLCGIARRHVKVALGGDGGDEQFGGYDRYYGNLYATYYALLPEGLRRHFLGALLEHLPDGAWYKSVTHQLKWLHRASFMSGGERYAQTLGYFYFGAEQREQLYGPLLADAARRFDPFAVVREAYEQAPASHPIDRMLYADSQTRLPDHSVMIVDRMSMAWGLEARSPFMDHKLAEFAARLPTRCKIRWRTPRYLQRRLGKRYLPESVLQRPKQGFTSALPYLLREEYQQLFPSLLSASRLARDGLLRQAGIDALLAEHAGGRVDHGNRLWLLANAEAWYRVRIQGEELEELEPERQEAPAGVREAEKIPVPTGAL